MVSCWGEGKLFMKIILDMNQLSDLLYGDLLFKPGTAANLAGEYIQH